MRIARLLILFALLLTAARSSAQDVDFHIYQKLLPGKNILKVKRNFHDPYLWVLAQNNEVYRLNSLTLEIDDFTNTFAAYGSLPFIDIAGRSADSVFIATNSTNIISYTRGAVKLVGAAQGMPGIVNGIGFNHNNDSHYESLYNYMYINSLILMVSTNSGLCYYDVAGNRVIYQAQDAKSQIFESTYKHFGFGLGGLWYPQESVSAQPVYAQDSNTTYLSVVWVKGDYGVDIKSVYTTSGDFYDLVDLSTYTVQQYWATETGLYAVMRNSAHGSTPLKYLSGININKITSLYGLTDFTAGGPGLAKETMLVGTDAGLYFSKSVYYEMVNGGIKQTTFFHYEELGARKINDVNVNNVTDSNKPKHPGCEDGVWVGADDGLYLLKPDYGKYLNSQKLRAIQFKDDPSVPAEKQFCAGVEAQLEVSKYLYSGNTIQWYKDGQELTGEHTPNLSVNQQGDYYTILYDACSGTHIESNHLKVTMVTAPTFSFNYPDVIPACEGTQVELKTEFNSTYQYRWYKDGVLNGNTTNLLNTNETGKYKIEVSACPDSWVASKEVLINITTVPVPVISTAKNEYCIGDVATLAVNDLYPTYTVSWFRDGSPLPEFNNKNSIVANLPGGYTVTINRADISCPQTSPPVALSFATPPTLSVEKLGNTPFCDGQIIDLKATYNSGSLRWSTGETTNTIKAKTSGIYTAFVKTAAGCEVEQLYQLQLFNKPTLNVPDAKLCQFNKESVTLTAPAGFARYEWNGVQGTNTFVTGALGAIALNVTDANGCTASQTINVTSYCLEIKFPNTFTPNGDGINDTWVIAGLEDDLSSRVQIFNRNGTTLLDSKGYPVPWDGKYHGKKVNAGVYYYIITAKNGKQVMNGALTIIY